MTEEQTTQKKGLGPLAWIAIGCGVLILLAFVLMSAGLWFGGKMVKKGVEEFEEDPARKVAELFVAMNPELEMVETDEDQGTITVRIKESGEVATFDYSEIQEGKLSFESSEGTMTFDASGSQEGAFFTVESDEGTATWGTDDIAQWLPDYPRTESLQVAYSNKTEDSHSGAFGFSTTDSVEQVVDFYREALEAEGFAVQENTSLQDGVIERAFLNAQDDATKRTAQVTIVPEGEGTQVGVTFNSGS